jgi:hypothetical protein
MEKQMDRSVHLRRNTGLIFMRLAVSTAWENKLGGLQNRVEDMRTPKMGQGKVMTQKSSKQATTVGRLLETEGTSRPTVSPAPKMPAEPGS